MRNVLKELLEPQAERAYALLRIVAGMMFAFHGMQKIFGVLKENPPDVGTQMWFGGLIELTAGIAIAVGIITPWAAFLASGTMAVAYFQFHWKIRFDSNFFPAINRGELAVLYCFVFLMIAGKGSGIWSVDALLASKSDSDKNSSAESN